MESKNRKIIDELACMSASDVKAYAARLKIRGRAGKSAADLRSMIVDQLVAVQDSQFALLGDRIEDRVHDLNSMKVDQLKKLAAAYKIRGRGGLKACDLRKAILDHINSLIKSAVEGPTGVTFAGTVPKTKAKPAPKTKANPKKKKDPCPKPKPKPKKKKDPCAKPAKKRATSKKKNAPE